MSHLQGVGHELQPATILTETALATPEAPVHLFGGTATTYRQLDEQSGRLAAGLREAGLGPGNVVALQLPNLPHFLTAYFGALKAGMVVLPLNPLLMAPELEYHLGDSSAAMLIGFEGMHAEARVRAHPRAQRDEGISRAA
jgi:long-chain acyl-CoA synthetase